jgi:hypothetical protein
MKKISKFLAVVSISLITLQTSSLPAVAQTSSWSGVCVSQNDSTVATIQGLQCLLANVLTTFLSLVGVAAFVVLIVSSFRILFSGGNSQDVEKAQKSITFAILGLIVALSAFVILNLISQFTGVESILKFSIPSSDTQWPQ